METYSEKEMKRKIKYLFLAKKCPQTKGSFMRKSKTL
jgi:hypothetical protein